MQTSLNALIANEHGITVGYIAEEPRGAWSTVARQVFRTRRPFRAVVMDDQGTPVLWVSFSFTIPLARADLNP